MKMQFFPEAKVSTKDISPAFLSSQEIKLESRIHKDIVDIFLYL